MELYGRFQACVVAAACAGSGLVAVNAIRDQLRSYDLIVRIGGDEFMCVMSGATIDYAHQRFAAIQTKLAADRYPCEIKVGFAALTDANTAVDLINAPTPNSPPAPEASDSTPHSARGPVAGCRCDPWLSEKPD